MRSNIFFLLMLVLSFSVRAAEKDYWFEAQLAFSTTLRGELNDESCYQSEKTFLGCLLALSQGVNELQLSKGFALPGEGVAPVTGFSFKVMTFPEFIAAGKAAFEASRPPQVRPSFKAVLDLLEQRSTPEQRPALTANVYNAFLQLALDPHTHIMTMAASQEDSAPSSVRGIFGLNFEIVKDETGTDIVVLRRVLPGSAAEKAGLKQGEVVLSLDGEKDPQKILQKFYGSSRVTAVVDGKQGPRELDLARAETSTDNVSVYLAQNGALKIGMVKLDSFMDRESCGKILSSGLQMVKEGVSAFILDLRFNGGGDVAVAKCIISLFLEPGSQVWEERDFDGRIGTSQRPVLKKLPMPFGKMPTVTLINGYSASASELTAIYLQSYRKSFLVGERSFGKGSMQVVRPLASNKKVLMAKTTALFYGPNGVSPQRQGITPDFVAYPIYGQSTPSEFEREEDQYPNALDASGRAPTDPERQQEVEKITGCMAREQRLQQAIAQMDRFDKFGLDYQLAVAMEVLYCFKLEKLTVPGLIKVPKVAPL